MSGSSGEQDRKNQELDALNVAALRSQDDEGEIPWEDLPELTNDERAALDCLGPDFVKRLLAGEWIVRSLRRALRQRDKAAIHDSISDLVRELGGKARTLIQNKLPGVLEITDFQTVLSRSLKHACDRIDDYDPSMHSLDVWFLQIVCCEALDALRHIVVGERGKLLQTEKALDVGKLLQNEEILEGMPDGVVLLDSDNSILWSNGRLCQWSGRDTVAGANFYTVLGSPEILGPDFCPFHTALATGRGTSSTLRSGDGRFFHIHAAPVREVDSPPRHLIVTVRDITHEMHQQQKLAAIHRAGMELADLTPDELSQMTIPERIELLKANVLHYTRDLLNFDVVEVRLLDQKTGRLEPLLSQGMEPEAATRVLFAQPQNNGVTGFVAATGKSYLCEDTIEDPLYLEGARDAQSSLTVPLVLHDEVIGTFNVESPEPRAFGESDLQFLEIFSRDVAVALNQLELLVAEKASTAAESCEAIHSAVALPVDEILNEAVNVMERYIGHEPEVVERLQRILRNARDIKQVIQMVGQKMAPAQAHPHAVRIEERPALQGRRVLVVDADENVRSAAHALLERYGCVVETAHDGAEAVYMVRAMTDGGYDVMIADIRLPDMTGYEFMLKLQRLMDPVPLVLMTGFGYDPGHSIVKARQAGLQAVLYKPFRLDQLLSTVEQVVQSPGPVRQMYDRGQEITSTEE